MDSHERRRDQQRRSLADVSLLRIDLDDEIPLEVEMPTEVAQSAPDAHVFISPDVIEVHLQHGQPISPGTAKLVWVIQQLFRQ